MGATITMFARTLATLPATGRRMMSADARPMTRFVQYPFDKTKMDEVTGWLKDSDLPATIRGQPGVSDVEMSFCPGLGYLGVRYIFADLEETVSAHEHFDASREPLEFKGFFLKGV